MHHIVEEVLTLYNYSQLIYIYTHNNVSTDNGGVNVYICTRMHTIASGSDKCI